MKDCGIEANKKACNCSYPCSRKGVCCECVAYHRGSGELPACYFSKEAERSYDRSIENYMSSRRGAR
jgi:hypothetical protein